MSDRGRHVTVFEDQLEAWAEIGLTSVEAMVLAVIRLHAHPDGTQAWPAVPTIARLALCSRPTATKAMMHLKTLGLLSWSRTGRTNAYTLNQGSGFLSDTLNQERTFPSDGKQSGKPLSTIRSDQEDQERKRASRERPARPPAAEEAEGRLETLLANLNGARAQVEEALAACASTRKGGRMSTGRALATLESLLAHGPELAAKACRTFTERHLAAEGKGEAYLIGIARGLGREATAKGAARAKREGIVPWA